VAAPSDVPALLPVSQLDSSRLPREARLLNLQPAIDTLRSVFERVEHKLPHLPQDLMQKIKDCYNMLVHHEGSCDLDTYGGFEGKTGGDDDYEPDYEGEPDTEPKPEYDPEMEDMK